MQYRFGRGSVVTLLLTAGIALLLGVFAGTPTASGAPPPIPPSVPSRVEATPFVAREVGPHTLVAQVTSGYCLGAPYRPSLERVAIRWRHLSPTRFAAELTAFVRTPVDPASLRAGEGPDSVQVCSGVASQMRAKVVLPQPLSRTVLFDASFSPPLRLHHHPPYWFAGFS